MCTGVSNPSKTPPPRFHQDPLKSANCPGPTFLDNSPLYIGLYIKSGVLLGLVHTHRGGGP